MSMKMPFPLIFVCALMASTASSAEVNMRPGLWKMTTTSDLLKLVPQLSSDQMQGLMNLAKQNGFDLPQIKDGAAISEVCITREMAEQDMPPILNKTQSGCTVKNATRAGNKYKLDFVCANSQLNGNGRAEGVFDSPERFSGRTEFDGVAQGNPVSEHADTSGRWVSASCGASKSPK